MLYAREKKSEISVDFSVIGWSGKKNPWKKRLKKFRRKIADFSEKIRHLADFSASGGHARRSAYGGDFFADFSAIN